MKSSFPRQLSIMIAALILFLVPLLYAGHFEEIVEEELTFSDDSTFSNYIFEKEVENMDLYSPENFAINVIVSATEDIGFALYNDPLYKERIVKYYEDLTDSREIAKTLLDYSSKQGVPFSLAASLMWAESGFDPMAYNNNVGSIDRGLFQLNSASFPDLTKKDFYDIETNIKNGIEHLSYCLKMGENDIVALAVYNAGHRRVQAAGAPLMSLDHISKILSYRDQLERDFERYISSEGKIRVYKKSDKNLIPVVDRKKGSK